MRSKPVVLVILLVGLFLLYRGCSGSTCCRAREAPATAINPTPSVRAALCTKVLEGSTTGL